MPLLTVLGTFSSSSVYRNVFGLKSPFLNPILFFTGAFGVVTNFSFGGVAKNEAFDSLSNRSLSNSFNYEEQSVYVNSCLCCVIRRKLLVPLKAPVVTC